VLVSAQLGAQDLGTFVNNQLPSLVSTYKTIHSHPELSHHEEHTSALLARA
jgi:hippurate hydrolase